jgi:hypothetical protein
MRRAFILLVCFALNACVSDQTQILLVSDYGYTLNGVSTTELGPLKGVFRLKDPITVEACSCANTDLVYAATQWLNAQGASEIGLKSISATEARCGACK